MLRGLATLGTFYVSAVAYGLPHASYFNLKSPGTDGVVDWVFAVSGEVVFDQKATVLLAMLFGAGIVLFADRAERAGKKPMRSAAWRSLLLFMLGVPVCMHGLLWEGTTLWYATWGLAVGAPLAVASVIWCFAGGYGRAVAVIGEAPNTLAALPMALGYLGVVALRVNGGQRTRLLERVAAVGQMALTNSIVQTAIGVAVLRDGGGRGELDRTGLVGVVVVMWILRLLWSKTCLDQFRFGPAEWVVRSVIYRRRQPFQL